MTEYDNELKGVSRTMIVVTIKTQRIADESQSRGRSIG